MIIKLSLYLWSTQFAEWKASLHLEVTSIRQCLFANALY